MKWNDDDPTVWLWKKLLAGATRGGRGKKKISQMAAIRREVNRQKRDTP